jgi:hypothetical protein
MARGASGSDYGAAGRVGRSGLVRHFGLEAHVQRPPPWRFPCLSNRGLVRRDVAIIIPSERAVRSDTTCRREKRT